MLRSVGQTLWGIVTRQPPGVVYVTDRIIVTPVPHGDSSAPTPKDGVPAKHLAGFLAWKHRGKVAVWHVCHGARDYNAALFEDQVIEVDLMPPRGVPSENDTPTLEAVWQVCYSVKFFLDWDAAHVAVLYTDGGTHKTALVVACLLTYLGVCDDCREAYALYHRKVMGGVVPTLPPCSNTCLVTFDASCHRSEPHTPPHTILSKVIVILPGVIASWPCPVLIVYQGRYKVYDSRTDAQDAEIVPWSGTECLSLNIRLCVQGDVQLHLLAGPSEDASSRKQLVLRYCFNTLTMPSSGSIPLNAKNVELFAPGLLRVPLFELHLVLEGVEEVDNPETVRGMPSDFSAALAPTRRFNVRGVNADHLGMVYMSNLHCLFPALEPYKQMEEEGFDPVAVACALKRTSNDAAAARELLETGLLAQLATLSQARSFRAPARPTVVPHEHIDVTYVTSRVLAVPSPWRHRNTDDRINDSELSAFLNKAHPRAYALFHLKAEAGRGIDVDKFGCQVVEFAPTLSTESQEGHLKYQLPSLQQMWEIVYAAAFWLDADPQHVVVLCSSAGRHQTGLVVACLLRYIGFAQHCRPAYRMYHRKRTGKAASRMPPCSVALLKAFDTECSGSEGSGAPVTAILNLILRLPGAIAAFECPIVQVYEGRELVFDTTHMPQATVRLCVGCHQLVVGPLL